MIRGMSFANDATVAAHSPSYFQFCQYKALCQYMHRFQTHYQPQKKNKQPHSLITLPSRRVLRIYIKQQAVSRQKDGYTSRQGDVSSCSPPNTIKTKSSVYNACVLSTLLYGSEPWITYATQESRLNIFYVRSLRTELGIFWVTRTPNTVVLSRCVHQLCLRCLVN